jgi:hypothetical protein
MTLGDGEKKHKKNLHTNNKSYKIQMEKTKKTTIKLSKIKHKEIRATKEYCHFGRRKKY